jgi:hypothetical protein
MQGMRIKTHRRPFVRNNYASTENRPFYFHAEIKTVQLKPAAPAQVAQKVVETAPVKMSKPKIKAPVKKRSATKATKKSR